MKRSTMEVVMRFAKEVAEDLEMTTEERDPLHVLGTCGLEPVVVDMMRRFGGETKETALIERILLFDPDFQLVWETQFLPHVDPNTAPILAWGLMTLFVNDISWTEDENFCSYEHLFFRWQHATRLLLKVGEAAGATGPWLFGWAMLGVELHSYVRAPRLQLHDKRVAKVVATMWIDAELGTFYADELPETIEEMRELHGVGDKVIERVEGELIKMLLEPQVYAPTVEAMLQTA